MHPVRNGGITKTSGRHDKATFQIAASDQFLDKQACHDCFASAGVIGQQKTQRLAWEHFPIHGRNLMRQGINKAGVNCQIGVKVMGKLYTVCLRNNPQKITVRIERPSPSSCINLDARLVIAVKRGFSDATALNTIYEIDDLITNPLDRHDLNWLT